MPHLISASRKMVLIMKVTGKDKTERMRPPLKKRKNVLVWRFMYSTHPFATGRM